MKYPFEIIKIQLPPKSKMPMVIEVPVPKACAPYLVGNPKQISAGPFKWVEEYPKSGNVFCWGLDMPLNEILTPLKNLILSRSEEEGWQSMTNTETDATKLMLDRGFDETEVVHGHWVVPKDSSMFGSVVVFDNNVSQKIFPVIHNPSYGVCFFTKE
jgi:hypothetical protein